MPDGKRVISGGKDKSLRLWDVRSGELLRTITGHHTGRLESLEISKDGRMLATGGGGGDTSVRLWDITAFEGVYGKNAGAATTTRPAGRVAESAKRPTLEFDVDEVDRLWRLLGSDDGDDVGVAMRRLVFGGDKAVAGLATRLTKPAASTPQEIAALIAKLDSTDPHVREQATCDLIQAGDAIEQPVGDALKRGVTPQVQHRLEMALRDVTTREPGSQASAARVLREANCVKLLGEIGTPAARELLTRIAR
jgi:hypothetical protein